MKIKFITCIYSDLNGTELGGRLQRKDHYRYGLLCLLKMTNADFICYTSDREIDDLKNFFYVENNINSEKLTLSIFDLNKTKHSELINQYKNIELTKKSDRCVEIQYSKFFWWLYEDKSYDYYYWIDAGLSHCGLIPNKFLTSKHSTQQYYESSLFNNVFLENLIKYSDEKFFLIGKENIRNFWDGTPNPKWYNEYNNSIHIIGGLFGGKKENWDYIVSTFENNLEKITNDEKRLWPEENIMTLMYFNNIDFFNIKQFDVWTHTDNYKSLFGETSEKTKNEYFQKNKSFYKVLEEMNS